MAQKFPTVASTYSNGKRRENGVPNYCFNDQPHLTVFNFKIETLTHKIQM